MILSKQAIIKTKVSFSFLNFLISLFLFYILFIFNFNFIFYLFKGKWTLFALEQFQNNILNKKKLIKYKQWKRLTTSWLISISFHILYFFLIYHSIILTISLIIPISESVLFLFFKCKLNIFNFLNIYSFTNSSFQLINVW